MWSSWYLCGTPSNRILIVSSASTIQAYLVLLFPILRQVSPRQFTGVLQGIAAGIGTSTFLRAGFIVSLNSSSFVSMKNIPLNCLALSSFGFSTAHVCFALLFAASDKCFHISGQTLSDLEVVCFQQYIKWRVCCSGDVDVLYRNRKCTVWVPRDDGKWNLP